MDIMINLLNSKKIFIAQEGRKEKKMKNNFTLINTIKEGETFYGIEDSFGNKYEAISASKKQVERLVSNLNKVGNVEPIHTPIIIENFFYDIVKEIIG